MVREVGMELGPGACMVGRGIKMAAEESEQMQGSMCAQLSLFVEWWEQL